MDSIDVRLATKLAMDGRASFAELASEVGLSAPSATERVRKLEAGRIIEGFSARLDPGAFGHDLTAFIWVSLDNPGARDGFLSGIAALLEVTECHHVAGEHDYLVKVACEGTSGLERLVSEGIKGIEGVSRTLTTVVLSSPVERPFVPVIEA